MGRPRIVSRRSSNQEEESFQFMDPVEKKRLRSYLQKYYNKISRSNSIALDDDWMAERDFIKHEDDEEESHWWWDEKITSLDLKTPLTIVPTMKCQAAIDIMNREQFDQLPVVNEGGYVLGMVTLGNLMGKMVSGKVTPDSPVSDCIYDQFKKVSLTSTLRELFIRKHYTRTSTVHRRSKSSSELSLEWIC